MWSLRVGDAGQRGAHGSILYFYLELIFPTYITVYGRRRSDPDCQIITNGSCHANSLQCVTTFLAATYDNILSFYSVGREDKFQFNGWTRSTQHTCCPESLSINDYAMSTSYNCTVSTVVVYVPAMTDSPSWILVYNC